MMFSLSKQNISPSPAKHFQGRRWSCSVRPEMGKYMFADPLDLIMINERNICSNVPLSMSPLTVSFIFNQSEWIRNGPTSSKYISEKLKSVDLM